MRMQAAKTSSKNLMTRFLSDPVPLPIPSLADRVAEDQRKDHQRQHLPSSARTAESSGLRGSAR
jgi:hypothetical protein